LFYIDLYFYVINKIALLFDSAFNCWNSVIFAALSSATLSVNDPWGYKGWKRKCC